MWVRFTADGTPAWFGPAPVDGAERVEGVDEETLLTCRRSADGKWVAREPVLPAPPTPEEIEAQREAAYQLALEARERSIDEAILASDAYRLFLRGGMTLTAYRDAASDIAASIPMPER